MNFQNTLKMAIHIFCLLGGGLYASDRSSEESVQLQERTPSSFARFFSFVNKVTHAVVAPMQQANATMEGLQNFLNNPQILYDFYKTKCVCPADMDSQLFQSLVEIALKRLVVRQGIVTVFKAYRQDQVSMSSDLEKAISDEILGLMQEPCSISLINLKKLPLFSGQIIHYLKSCVDEMRRDSQNNTIKLVEELVIASSQIFDRLPINFKQKTMQNPRCCYEIVRSMYNELGLMFNIFEHECFVNLDIVDATLYKELFVIYLAVVQESIRLGYFNYYDPSQVDVFYERQRENHKKIQELYFQEKCKYLFISEHEKRILIQDSANKELLVQSADQGVLSPVKFKELNCNFSDVYTMLGQNFQRDANKIECCIAADKLRIQEEKQRVLLQEELKTEQLDVQKAWCYQLWKDLGQLIARTRIKDFNELKLQKQIEVDQALEQQYNREQQTMQDACEQVKKRTFIAYVEFLRKLSKKEKTTGAVIVQKQASALQLQEKIDHLRAQNHKRVVSKYWHVLQMDSKDKKEIRSIKQLENIDSAQIYKDEDQARRILIQRRITEKPRKNNPYLVMLMPGSEADEEEEFVGWGYDNDGNCYYWPGQGRQPGYWNPQTRLLEW